MNFVFSTGPIRRLRVSYGRCILKRAIWTPVWAVNLWTRKSKGKQPSAQTQVKKERKRKKKNLHCRCIDGKHKNSWPLSIRVRQEKRKKILFPLWFFFFFFVLAKETKKKNQKGRLRSWAVLAVPTRIRRWWPVPPVFIFFRNRFFFCVDGHDLLNWESSSRYFYKFSLEMRCCGTIEVFCHSHLLWFFFFSKNFRYF